MKNTIKTSLVAGLLLTIGLQSSAFAVSTETAIMKGTVKLIKENRIIKSQLASIEDVNIEQDIKIKMNSSMIEEIQDKLEITTELSTANKENNKLNKQDITSLANIKSSNDIMKKDVEELKTVVSKSTKLLEDQTAIAEKNNKENKLARENSVNLTAQILILQQKTSSMSSKADANSKLTSEVNRLTQENELNKKLFEEKLLTLKRVLGSQIEILKAKMERLKPVYIVTDSDNSTQVKECKDGKCKKVPTKTTEEILNNYIK